MNTNRAHTTMGGIMNSEALWQMGPDGTCTYPVTQCTHEHVRQISEHDVECTDCGLVSA